MFQLGGSDGESDYEQAAQPQTIDALKRIRFHHAGKHTRLGNETLKRVEQGESAAAILDQWSEVRHHFKACLDANDDMMHFMLRPMSSIRRERRGTKLAR